MKVLVVEDDLSLSDVLSFTLRRAGYAVVTAFDGRAALQQWQGEQPDLIILDLNLPKLDGLAVCRQIRSESQTPIIILSVRSDDETIVHGLGLGADDYMVKPFSPSQLLARIQAVARRTGVAESAAVLEMAGLALERSRNEVRGPDGDTVRLTPLEAKLLEALMLHPDQVMTSDWLITAVWGAEAGDRTMLKQLVYRLRAQIDQKNDAQSLIETIPGIGYCLNELV
jgi:DNA-binding response OmpR family regulator